jgi:hypothetical protein
MRQQLTGQLQEPGQRPKNVRLILDKQKEQFDNVKVTTTAYTVQAKTYVLVDDDTAGSAVTITLPPVIENTDRWVYIKKLGTTANVIADGNGSETIDGATTKTITSQYGTLSLLSDGKEWHVF